MRPKNSTIFLEKELSVNPDIGYNVPMNRFLPGLPDTTQFERLARLIHRLTGVTVDTSRRQMLTNRLRPLWLQTGCRDWSGFLEHFDAVPPPPEQAAFIDAVTTHETRFNRNPDDFKLLRRLVPQLQEQFPGKTLRFFSAACSFGHETWELACYLSELQESLPGLSFSVSGMDISEAAVIMARRGSFTPDDIARLPSRFRRRYFVEEDDKANCTAGAALRRKVEFFAGNLFTTKMPASHAVFCRNVMIYFTRKDKQRLAARLFSTVLPGGLLFPGESETLPDGSGFEILMQKPALIYRRPPG